MTENRFGTDPPEIAIDELFQAILGQYEKTVSYYIDEVRKIEGVSDTNTVIILKTMK